MKKLLVLLAAVLLILAAAAAVFIATFDLNKYRPRIVKELEMVLGRPVRIERLSLAWRGGIAVDIGGLSIDESTPHAGSMIQAQRISTVIQLMPLLKKTVVISSLEIARPVISVERLPDGHFNLQQISLPAVGTSPQAPAGNPPPRRPAPAAQPSAGGPLGLSAAGAGNQLNFAVQRIHISDGVLRYSDPTVQPPLELTVNQIRLEAVLRPDEVVEVKSFSARLQPAASSDGPSLRGKLSGSFNGSLRTLTGKGNMMLEEGAVVHFNLLREVFQKISIIPGLVERLLANLPSSYQEKFQSPDTVLKKITLALSVTAGSLIFRDLQIETDTFELTGSADALFDGTVGGSAVLRVDQELSAAMIHGVSELEYLADAKNRIQLPVVFQGKSPKILVAPDLNYLTQHLLGNKVQDIVGGLLGKMLEKGLKKKE